MLYCLIPIKDLDGAKTRLAGVLDGGARRELVVAMYRDVLRAATTCGAIAHVAVVTNDADARSIAEGAGAETIAEGSTPSSGSGLNQALSYASAVLRQQGVERLLVLFTDLPLANAAAVERVARANADVVLVPSTDGGTNALALAPGAVEFQYGPGSAAKHIEAAEARGLRVATLDEPALAFDIDTREELEQLANRQDLGRYTADALRRIASSSTMTTQR